MATMCSREEGLHRGRRNIRISTNRKFTSVHMCRALRALAGMMDTVRCSHQHTQLPPAQGDRYVSRASGPAKLHTA